MLSIPNLVRPLCFLGVPFYENNRYMLVICSLCALLTSLTLIGHFQTRINKLTLENEIALEQIGEDFLASVKAGEIFEKSYENYVYSKDVNGNLYALSVAASRNRTRSSMALLVPAISNQI